MARGSVHNACSFETGGRPVAGLIARMRLERGHNRNCAATVRLAFGQIDGSIEARFLLL